MSSMDDLKAGLAPASAAPDKAAGLAEMAKYVNHSRLPTRYVDGMRRYIEEGRVPGHFLTAVLTNDLFGAFSRADLDSKEQTGEGDHVGVRPGTVAVLGIRPDRARLAGHARRRALPARCRGGCAGRTRPSLAATGDAPRRPRSTRRPPCGRGGVSTILAIDPGYERSAWLLLESSGLIREHAVWPNDDVLALLRAQQTQFAAGLDQIVIEKIESFGMPVGIEVLDTVYWSGRFAEAAYPLAVERLSRRAVKLALCGSARAKDGNVRAALIDRFGGPTAIGRKATPGPLYGISGDVWSALAVAVCYADGVR